MLVLTAREVDELLDLDHLVDALADAMRALSEGRVSVPPRIAALVAERDAILAAMPAYLPSAGVLESKLVSVFPHNVDRPSHQAVIVAFDPRDGTPVALLDATRITELRTAAGSALATRLLARADASVMALVGTGVQARAHARAVSRVRPVAEIRVAGRSLEKAEAFVRGLEGDLPVRPVASCRDAVEGADIVCCATHSHEPVVMRGWLSAGTHVNSVGVNAEGPEVDPNVVHDALVVVESRGSALAPFPAGAAELQGLGPDDVVEVGELVAGTRAGRTSPDQITFYKSVGVGVQDAAAVGLVLEAARERGAGVQIEL